jgi:hypothetical protein
MMVNYLLRNQTPEEYLLSN